MDDLVTRASRYATNAHARIEHRRKYTGQPYDAHLSRVAEIVSTVTDDPESLAAAWLHDTVEDTPATYQDIEVEFGHGVAQLVTELTDISRPSDGNRAARRAIDRAHLGRASARSQTIKLADLIDNCGDICKHDARFGRVFLSEMSALLEVLSLGDERLQARARKVHAKFSKRLGVDPSDGGHEKDHPDVNEAQPAGQHPFGAWRSFARVFAARDVAEPLRSFDGDRPAAEIAEKLSVLGLAVVGVRRDGSVAAYVRAQDLRDGVCDACARDITPDQRIDGDASLTEVIRILTRHEYGFVTALEDVTAIVSRADVQKPAVRMWLFGMITLTELRLVDRIRAHWPDGEWVDHLSSARLEKARELQAERERREQPCDLLDCLQLSDKASVLIAIPEEMAAFGFESKKAARRVIADAQSLRNNLAHAQDIVSNDWPQIARLAARVESMLTTG